MNISSLRPAARQILILAGVLAAAWVAHLGHALDLAKPLDNGLAEERMAVSPRRASGSIAFVAIDKQSLDSAGVWPWPRSIYGRILSELSTSRVRDIAFDIDFSTKSSAAEDAAFAEALSKAGGGVILPAFLQRTAVERSRQHLALSQPIPEFADNAWVASVNVVPDDDGIVRAIPSSIPGPDGPLAAMPALLASAGDSTSGLIGIDYSINPDTVPVYSVATLLDGKLSKGALDGKSVIIGAHAIELKDYFTVPVHGSMAGPMVQVLAAETLLQKRSLQPVDDRWALGAYALALAAFFLFLPQRLTGQILVLVAFGLLTELAANILFRQYALLLPTAAFYVVLALVALARVLIELDLRRWLLKLAALETRNTRQILKQVITDNSDAILVADEQGRVIEKSVRVADVFRPRKPRGHNRKLGDILPPRLMMEVRDSLDAIRTGLVEVSAVREIELQGPDGTRYVEYSITPSRLESAKGSSFIVCIAARDITERRRQDEALDRLSRTDELTGALRQTEFVARLDVLLATSATLPITVYSLNLHRFKTVNATLGRDVGDNLLQKVVRALEIADPTVKLVGRTGGDSFCLACIGHGGEGEAERFAETLTRTLGLPFILGENRAKVGVHVGIAGRTGGAGEDAAMLLDRAEFALDAARATNGSGWTRFDPAASDRIIQSRRVERELWRSLERNQISVYYQPQVSIKGRKVVGAEALVRWNHPELGTISPADFVEIAEANGFVEKLGQWVLWRACADAKTWEQPISVAVNISPLQFTRGDVVNDVQQALMQSGLPPERLHLEITESTFLDKSDELIAKLEALKSLGITIALDDFGTGYSSFGYLATFPLDKLKVDQMFIKNLTESPSSQAIMRSVRSLCDGLAITMICEGVETEEQLAFLDEIGVEQAQGYLFGKPIPNDEISAIIRSSMVR